MLGEGKPFGGPLTRYLALHDFMGPARNGKTTLAELMAATAEARFEKMSAISAGVKDIRKVVEDARAARLQLQQATILFIDEVHRFNKAQQDVFLPFVEDGTFILIGATTENPSFELNGSAIIPCPCLCTKAPQRNGVNANHRACTHR